MKYNVFYFGVIGFLILTSCQKNGDISPIEEQDWYTGGSQTSYVFGSGAYGQAFANLTGQESFVHDVGDKAFEATFVTAPAPKNSGLGPIFNSVSCFSCHVGDGRGKPPVPGEQFISLLIRLSLPGQDQYGGPLDVPGFGGQFQQKSIFGIISEGAIDLNYTYQTYYFPDGTTYELQTPSYSIINPYTTFPGNVMLSPRIAPPVFGLGLIEAIPDWAILAKEDISDVNNDGISGKANYVWNIDKKQLTIGKFGWKSNTPSLIQQIAAAYNQDMGITNRLFPFESSKNQPQDDLISDDVELSDSLLHAVTFYMQTLAVPARRDVKNDEVQKGKKLFYDAKCVACHTPKQRTAVNVAFPAISNQLIFPYTDLLLHDMGEALSDQRTDYLAQGNEWRTPPLWGIGLTEIVNGHSNFLHDGRARTLIEAIMWHGGEAENSKNVVKNMTLNDRNALIKFLRSL